MIMQYANRLSFPNYFGWMLVAADRGLNKRQFTGNILTQGKRKMHPSAWTAVAQAESSNVSLQ